MRRYFRFFLAICTITILTGCYRNVTQHQDKKSVCYVKSGKNVVRNADVYVMREVPEYFSDTDNYHYSLRRTRTQRDGCFYLQKPELSIGNRRTYTYYVLVEAAGHMPAIKSVTSSQLPETIRLLPSSNPKAVYSQMEEEWLRKKNSPNEPNPDALPVLVMLYSHNEKKDILPLIQDVLQHKNTAWKLKAVSLLAWHCKIKRPEGRTILDKEEYDSPKTSKAIECLVDATANQDREVSEAALAHLALIAYRDFSTPADAGDWWLANKNRPRKQWILNALSKNPSARLKYRAAGDLVIIGDRAQKGADTIAHAMKSNNPEARKWAKHEYNRIRGTE